MLRDVMQPFAVCARTVLLNVSIIASISAILLLIVRYIFLRICLSDETGLPYAQDSLVFGFAATNLGRAVALAPMARRKLLIHPLVDQVGITIIGTSSNVLMWMSQASWGGIDFVYKSCIPVFVITGFLTSWTINSAKQVSVLAEIFYHFTNSIAFVVLYSCYMCVSVLCFHISNQRVVVFMNRIEVTLSERILGYVYNLLLLGVGFPMLRYILIFLNKSVIVAWRAPKTHFKTSRDCY
ncbi:hypothetical protein BC829DRAFT_207469 [Chytridium lagenaria]|nr:hypothetical protein BC829DRAFT_207469 [Chytridium lagenaria]